MQPNDAYRPDLDPQDPVPAPVPEPRRFPFWGYSDLGLFLAMSVGLFVAVGLILALIAILLGGARGEEFMKNPLALIGSQLVVELLLVGFLFVLFRVRYAEDFLRGVEFHALPVKLALPAFLLGPILAVATALLIAALRPPKIASPFDKFLRDPTSLALLFVFAVCIGPIFEELIFRGLLFPLLRRDLGLAGGLVVSGFLFGLIHAGQYGWAWQPVAGLTFTGAVLGFIRHWTGSTLGSTLTHATYNLALFAVMLLQLKLGKLG